MAIRTPKQVIDQAVKENKTGEMLLYLMACGLFLLGLFFIVWAVVARQPLAGIPGGISELLFVPALNAARQTRRESVAIRLLEAPLSRADTAKEASEMLWQFFNAVMIGKQPADQALQKAASEHLSRQRQ